MQIYKILLINIIGHQISILKKYLKKFIKLLFSLNKKIIQTTNKHKSNALQEIQYTDILFFIITCSLIRPQTDIRGLQSLVFS